MSEGEGWGAGIDTSGADHHFITFFTSHKVGVTVLILYSDDIMHGYNASKLFCIINFFNVVNEIINETFMQLLPRSWP